MGGDYVEYVVFDIETTGLDTLNDRIIELGAIRIKDNEVVGEFSKLINPGIPIPSIVTTINGITNEMVENEDYPGVVLSLFNKFIEGVDFLIGHNAIRFDYPFLKSEFKRNYVKSIDWLLSYDNELLIKYKQCLELIGEDADEYSELTRAELIFLVKKLKKQNNLLSLSKCLKQD